jgi:hypothetical protein
MVLQNQLQLEEFYQKKNLFEILTIKVFFLLPAYYWNWIGYGQERGELQSSSLQNSSFQQISGCKCVLALLEYHQSTQRTAKSLYAA